MMVKCICSLRNSEDVLGGNKYIYLLLRFKKVR